jgi:ABC-2 type transport system permease protein
MRPTLTLIRREFNAYFQSPIAYVVLAIFLAVTGYLFYLTLDALTASGPKGISYPLELFVNSAPFWLVFAALAPLLTMRLFAEERSSGTLEMLMTAPVSDWQVVFAKYLACYAFYAVMWLPTLLYLPILTDAHWHKEPWSVQASSTLNAYVGLGMVALLLLLFAIVALVNALQGRRFLAAIASLAISAGVIAAVGYAVWPIVTQGQWIVVECYLDPRPILTTYLGLALAGAMFLAIGIFISSMVKSQMVAALVSLFLGLIFVVGAIWRPEMDTSGVHYQVLYYITVPYHFERNFGRGLIDTRNLVFYGTTTLLGLFLTVRSLESRRWQ